MNELNIDPFLLSLSAKELNQTNAAMISNGGLLIEPPVSAVPQDYDILKVPELKQLCKERNLKRGGKKPELVTRLQDNDKSNYILKPSQLTASSQTRLDDHIPPLSAQSDEVINTEQMLKDSERLSEYFELGWSLESELSGDEPELADEDDEDDEEAVVDMVMDKDLTKEARDEAHPHASVQWADDFILKTRRKGGRQTEKSVLKQWNAWVIVAIKEGKIQDDIIDSVHLIEYLKYAATRKIFTTRGVEKTSDGRLSASSLKKIMTMLGRVRRRQEDDNASIKEDRPSKNSRTNDFYKALMVQAQRFRLESENFDITQGTILDSKLSPAQFIEITDAILMKLTQLPSIVKAHFSWTWQCSSLNRSDEVVSLLLGCIHPYRLSLPTYTYEDGKISSSQRDVFGVLALFHETKTAKPGQTEPKYSFALPHRDPLSCPVGALAILMHFMFDQQDLTSRVADWDWGNTASWHKYHVVFGKTVDEGVTGDGLGRMYTTFLDFTSINPGRKTHLARRTMPGKLEEMGVPADQVDAAGHWVGNTRREVYSSKIPKAAAVALAGFPVGESYYVSWAQVPVPEGLEKLIYPFCEDELGKLRAQGCQNQGAMNLLLLLQELRPFFWRTIAAIKAQYPMSPIIKRLKVLQLSDAQAFLGQWRGFLEKEEGVRHQSLLIEQTFSEAPTRNAFTTLTSQVQTLQRSVDIITRRTELFSPSKAESLHDTITHTSHLSVKKGQRNDISIIRHAPPLTLSPSHVPPTVPISPARPASQVQAQPQTPPRFFPTQTNSSPLCTHGTAAVTVSPSYGGKFPLVITQIGAYHVLHLTPPNPAYPNQHPPHTPHDLILPPPTAFALSIYPQFTTKTCTWQHIFDEISNPVALWATYCPGTLSSYSDVKSLWQSWESGTFLSEIGHKPPLQLIDSRWGGRLNVETKKKKLPAWRPRNDHNVRRRWSDYRSFVEVVEKHINEGRSTDAAVLYLDESRKGRSMGDYFKTLPKVPKKRKRSENGPD